MVPSFKSVSPTKQTMSDGQFHDRRIGTSVHHRRRHRQRPKDLDNPAYRLNWQEHVRQMADLTPLTRLVLAQLIEDQRIEGYAYRSQGKMAKKLGCCVRSVVNAMNTLRADETIHSEAHYRTGGRGRSASRTYVNFGKRRFEGCPVRAFPVNLAAQASCADVLSANFAEASLQRTIEPICQSQRPLEVVAATAETTTDKAVPVKVELPDPAKLPQPDESHVEAFRAGVWDWCKVGMQNDLAVHVLTLLIALNLRTRLFLQWVAANHSPAKARTSAFGLWRHLIVQAMAVPTLRNQSERTELVPNWAQVADLASRPYLPRIASSQRLPSEPESGRSGMPPPRLPSGIITGTAGYLVPSRAPAPPAEPEPLPAPLPPEPEGPPPYDFVAAIRARGVNPVIFADWRRQAGGNGCYDPPRSDEELDALLPDFYRAHPGLRGLPRPRSDLTAAGAIVEAVMPSEADSRIPTRDEVDAWLQAAGVDETPFLMWLWDRANRPRRWPASEAATRSWIARYQEHLARKLSG